VVPVTPLLVPNVIVVNAVAEHIDWLLFVTVATGAVLTVTVALLEDEHPVDEIVSVNV